MSMARFPRWQGSNLAAQCVLRHRGTAAVLPWAHEARKGWMGGRAEDSRGVAKRKCRFVARTYLEDFQSGIAECRLMSTRREWQKEGTRSRCQWLRMSVVVCGRQREWE